MLDGTSALAAGIEPPLLAVAGLHKRFGARSAVNGVGFGVRHGSIHGLLGPNGAGKTTVLRMLLGTVRPDAGTIVLSGRPLPPEVPRGRCGIAGFVESPNFYPYLTASRNLELLSAWDGRTGSGTVEDLLDLVGLTDRAQSKVRGFSTGLRQRLGLAAALISDPQVLIMDEPTTGLDPAGIRDLHALMAALAQAGHTIVLSSHDLDEVEQLCTEVTVLRSGSVVHTGSLAALRELAPQRVWRLHTSDDEIAAELAGQFPRLEVVPSGLGDLLVHADTGDLDRYTMLLAARGVAVRGLGRDEMTFEALFFQLTDPGAADPRAADRNAADPSASRQ